MLSILPYGWKYIDSYGKLQSEISDHSSFSQNWIFFLQGVEAVKRPSANLTECLPTFHLREGEGGKAAL